ncbi:MAG: PQQ-binding-like beta-propeller repeat protein [Gammaproteobacteria bacterium]|nr:PQQ-binding-like beta-propeller repeat protein [Gammaproteobacteria bacterium]
MTDKLGLLAALVAVLGLVGCGAEQRAEQQPRQAAEAAAEAVPPAAEDGTDFEMADTSSPGGQVYFRSCASCHEGGVDRSPQRAMLLLMSPESIHRSLTAGVMQAQAAGLSAEEKVAVAEFLAKRSMAGAAEIAGPPRCEENRFDFSEPPVFTGWGLTPASTHRIPTALAGLTPANIDSLKLKWALAFPGASRARSAPALAGGLLFVGSHGGTVFALDRETGCARWSFDASAEVRTGIVVSPWPAGDAAAQPMAFFGDLIGNLYGVDALTGELRWRARPDDHPNTTLTGTPTLHEDTLYVPVSSLEVVPAADPAYECCSFRGSVVAYDARTGEIRWQTFTIADEPEPQGVNAAGTQNYGPSGAPIWNSPAIDIERSQLLVGTGENYSSPADGASDAIFAIDLATGAINWIFQATAGDAWNMACGPWDRTNCPVEDGPDYDFGAGTVVAQDADGRDLVVAGQKSGVVHALDVYTGEPVWQTKVGRGGIHGGVYFGMAAAGGRLFVPISDTDDGREYPEPARPGLYALDLRNGEYLWKVPAPDVCRDDQEFCQRGYSQAITATPELVFAGGNDGYMRVFDASSGDLLWELDTARDFPALGGVTAQGGAFGGGAAPLAYQGDLILSSGYGFAGKMPGNALLVFEAGR